MILFGAYLVLFFVSINSAGAKQDELVALSMLFRHGERAPEQFYPNDPYQDESYWSVQPGELLNVGKIHHHELGKWLRQNYDSFLPSQYSPKDIYIRSADINRCLESAASDLSGLYPPEGDQIWDPRLPWMPIPIHTVPIEEDTVIELLKPCPNLLLEEEKLMSNGSYKQFDDDNRELYKYLSHHTGENYTNFFQVSKLYDTLLVEKLANLDLPEWTESVFPEPLQTCAKRKFTFNTASPKMTKFWVGQILDKIVQQFNSFIYPHEKPVQKFMVYSTHDRNIFDLLQALKTKNSDLVPYAATLIFELRKIDGEFIVRMIYVTDDLSALNIDGGEVDCPFGKFLEVVRPLALNEEEWEKACHKDTQ